MAADTVQVLMERTFPVTRSHLVLRDRGLAILSGDGERQPAPRKYNEGRVRQPVLLLFGGGATDHSGKRMEVSGHGSLGKIRSFLGGCVRPLVFLDPTVFRDPLQDHFPVVGNVPQCTPYVHSEGQV